MSYRKFFMLIVFAPFALLLLGGEARAQCFLDPFADNCDPWGPWGPGGGGSTVSCTIGFGDVTMTGLQSDGTVTLKNFDDNTFSCTLDSVEQGQGNIASTGIVVSGIQAGKCIKTSPTTSQKEFFAKCGSGDVEGAIQVSFSSESGLWKFGGADIATNTTCKQLFPATGPFKQLEIFTTTVSYNNANCSGSGNDGKANFRSCTGSDLNNDGSCNNNLNTGIPILSTATSGGLVQISTFGLDCQRLPTNQTSCPNSNGIITATLHLDNASNISSVKCGNPDDPFLTDAKSFSTSGNDLNVTCYRCDQTPGSTGVFVPGPDGTLVVTAQQADSPTANFSHTVGGLCDVLPTSSNP